MEDLHFRFQFTLTDEDYFAFNKTNREQTPAIKKNFGKVRVFMFAVILLLADVALLLSLTLDFEFDGILLWGLRAVGLLLAALAVVWLLCFRRYMDWALKKDIAKAKGMGKVYTQKMEVRPSQDLCKPPKDVKWKHHLEV